MKFREAMDKREQIYDRLREQRRARGDLTTCIPGREVDVENPQLARSTETLGGRIWELDQELSELADQINKAEVI